jgi:hypothetical protein
MEHIIEQRRLFVRPKPTVGDPDRFVQDREDALEAVGLRE